MKKLKKYGTALLSMIIFVLSFSCLYSQEEDHSKHQCIVINTSSEVDLGTITIDSPALNCNNDAIIKYEILCCTDRKIKINIINNISNENLNISYEWKAGAITGFEEQFKDGDIFTVSKKKFYVTVKIKSISAGSASDTGLLYLTPTIQAEYWD